MPKQMFVGAGVALPTFFDEKGEVNFEAIGRVVDLVIDHGADYLVPCGTTGESPTLSHDEQKAIIKFVIKKNTGRLPVLAGTGANCTKEAVDLTAYAKSVGAHGALSVTPYYNKPTPVGCYKHFRDIAEVGLPVMLYDIPGRTSMMFNSGVLKQLVTEGHVFGLKWASGDLKQLMSLKSALGEDILIVSGDDNLTLPAMSLGAEGVISVAANLATEKVMSLCHLALTGDFLAASLLHYELLPLFEVLFIETNPIPIKEALSLLYPELSSGSRPVFRLPLCGLTDEDLTILTDVLFRCKVIGNK